jgi:hypothetical protein
MNLVLVKAEPSVFVNKVLLEYSHALFFFFFLVVLEIELRASGLLGRRLSTDPIT